MDDFNPLLVDLLIRSLLHQLASPLVAASGYLEMMTDDNLSLSPRQKSTMAEQSHESVERAIDMLIALEQLQQLVRVEPKIRAHGLHIDQLIRSKQVDDTSGVVYSVRRSYRLPSVLIDEYVFEDALTNIIHFFAGTKQVRGVQVEFRNRSRELIVKFEAGDQMRSWLQHFRVFWNYLTTNYQLVDTTGPIMNLVTAQLQLHRIGAKLNFVQIRRGEPALYIHLPLASQLHLPIASSR